MTGLACAGQNESASDFRGTKLRVGLTSPQTGDPSSFHSKTQVSQSTGDAFLVPTSEINNEARCSMLASWE